MMLGLGVFAGTGMAQGIQSGDTQGSVDVWLGSALEKSDLEIDGKRLSWGNLGAGLGMSYLYFPEAHLGLGLGFQYTNFQGSDSIDYIPGRWFWHTLESDFETDTLHLMAQGRININPSSAVRVYLPFGVGAGVSVGTMTYTWDDLFEDEYLAANFSWGWYGGIGVEFAQSDRSAWSIEARYNTFRFDDRDFADQIGAVVLDNNRHSYVSLAVKFSFK